MIALDIQAPRRAATRTPRVRLTAARFFIGLYLLTIPAGVLTLLAHFIARHA